MEQNTFFKRDDRLYYPFKPTWGFRWRLLGWLERYFIISPRIKLEPFLKLCLSAPPIRGMAFSVGFFGAGIRRHLTPAALDKKRRCHVCKVKIGEMHKPFCSVGNDVFCQ